MYKYEFLTELRNKLTGLPKEDLENRLSFYEEMINDRMDEGKSEEEAVAEVGNVDDIVKQIAGETSLVKLVKEKTKPKRSFRGWEIAIIILGFPLWFPLLITAFVLILVAYILLWTLVIVAYSVELSLITGALGGSVASVAYLMDGNINTTSIGATVMCAGGAILMVFGCIGATKLTIFLSKQIILAIKTAFIRKGN